MANDAIDIAVSDSIHSIDYIASYFSQFALQDIDEAREKLMHAESAAHSICIEADVKSRVAAVTDLYMSMLLTYIIDTLTERQLMPEDAAEKYAKNDACIKKKMDDALTAFYDPIDAALLAMMKDFSLQCMHGICDA